MDGSQDGGSNAPPPFLTKTYDMIDDPSTNPIVSWSQASKSFIVWNPPDFARDLLPKYFKHNNFSSFVRQLNTYGFRKIDPDQWEFANEDFIRGKRHLLKNIHRRKPIHSHSLQNTQGQGAGALAESVKHELEEEIEKLKHDKSLLLQDLQTYTQERKGMELQMQSLEDRLHQMEHHQRQMMDFLVQIMQKPGFVPNLIQQSEKHNKKRRLPKIDYFCNEADTEGNQIVTFKSVSRERSDAIPMLILNVEPFEKLESSLTCWEKFLHGVGQASGEEMYTGEVPLQSSAVVLTEIRASSGDTDINLWPQSRRMHSSSPCSRDIHSSPELAESTSFDETPIISSSHFNDDIRPKDLGIDVNSKPAAPPEIDSSKGQGTGTMTATVPTGLNDVFWEQFLTETPGSSDTQEVQSERRDTDYSKNDSKPSSGGIHWWNMKNVDNLTEKMGQLTPAGRT